MSFSRAELRCLVASASTVFERARESFAPDPSRDAEAVAATRLDRWQQRAAGGSEARFAQYLCWHHLDPRTARRAVGPTDFRGRVLPRWAEVLREVDRSTSRGGSERIGRRRSAAEPEPFEEAFDPFLRVASRRLDRLTVGSRSAGSATAHEAFERVLLRRLTRIASRTLYAEFSAFRSVQLSSGAGQNDSVAMGLTSIVDGGRPIYDGFICDLERGGFHRVLATYPVLARLLATRVIDWAESTAEFFRRLDADCDLLERVFARGSSLGSIACIDPDLSDPHRRGRTVCRVVFASGVDVVYKPRDLGLEAAYASLIAWLNASPVSLPLKAAAVLNRGTHGWMEHVAASACSDRAEVDRYYHRAGMVLALAYVLGGADLHQGNLIANGEYPVLIDVEAFLDAPFGRGRAGGRGHVPGCTSVEDSVLRAGLLPLCRRAAGGRIHRNGGLVDIDVPYGPIQPRWVAVNTDTMRLETRPPVLRGANLPTIEGRAERAGDHVEAIVAGFEEMCGVLRCRATQMVTVGGVLRRFQAQRHRIVLRDTATYATLLESVLHPGLLRDGAEWSIALEILAASGSKAARRPRAWRLWRAERRALRRLDIPLFESRSDSTAISDERGTVVGDYLVEPGYVTVVARLTNLTGGDVAAQRHCIRLALRCTDVPEPVHVCHHADAPHVFAAEARRIGDILRRAACDTPGAEINWLGIRGRSGSAACGLRLLEWDLYGGRCGVALFFAALEHCGVWPGAGALARRIVAPLLYARGAPHRLRQLEIFRAHGAVGLGGVAYALFRMSSLLQHAPLLDRAEQVAAAIDPEWSVNGIRHDVLGGIAGDLLGLLAVYSATSNDVLLDRAVRCGRHLVAWDARRRTLVRDSSRDDHGRRVGFGHGLAGITYALSRLYRATGEVAFRRAAIETLDQALAGGRPPGEAAMEQSWCRGTPGIALARLCSAALLNAPELLAGVDEALSAAAAGASPWLCDQMCCGAMGRVELLLKTAELRQAPAFHDSACMAVQKIIARARQDATYAITGIDDVFSPGFYQGLAGIGYELLRLNAPDLPSVVLWE